MVLHTGFQILVGLPKSITWDDLEVVYNKHKKSDKSIFLIIHLNLGDLTFRSQDVGAKRKEKEASYTNQVHGSLLHAKEAVW